MRHVRGHEAIAHALRPPLTPRREAHGVCLMGRVTDLNPTSQAQAEIAALPACAAGSGGMASGLPVIVDMRSANVH